MRRQKYQRRFLGMIIGLFVLAAAFSFLPTHLQPANVTAQTTGSPTPEFDQAAALAKVREQIKGRENEPASAVFKNIQTSFLKSVPAGRLPAVMEIAYSRSLGVDCTHCHVPDKWEADDRLEKQIARDMSAMVLRINGELLKGIKNLKSPAPTVNCTTCHRGQTKPALNLSTQVPKV